MIDSPPKKIQHISSFFKGRLRKNCHVKFTFGLAYFLVQHVDRFQKKNHNGLFPAMKPWPMSLPFRKAFIFIHDICGCAPKIEGWTRKEVVRYKVSAPTIIINVACNSYNPGVFWHWCPVPMFVREPRGILSPPFLFVGIESWNHGTSAPLHHAFLLRSDESLAETEAPKNRGIFLVEMFGGFPDSGRRPPIIFWGFSTIPGGDRRGSSINNIAQL